MRKLGGATFTAERARPTSSTTSPVGPQPPTGSRCRASTRSGPTSSSAASLVLDEAFQALGHRGDDRLRLRPAGGRPARRHPATRGVDARPPPRPALRVGRSTSLPSRRGRRPTASGSPTSPSSSSRARSRLHGLGDEHEELLEAAGLLCNVGLAISHDRHHLHSYYVIRNTDLLTGFTDHEVELIALDRPLPPQVDAQGPPRRVRPARRRRPAGGPRARRTAARRRRSRPHARGPRPRRARRCRRRQARPIRVSSTTGERDAELELYSAEARKDLLEDALGVVRSSSTRREATVLAWGTS